jgi:hypothetical protein
MRWLSQFFPTGSVSYFTSRRFVISIILINYVIAKTLSNLD